VAALGARSSDGRYTLRVLDAKGKAVPREVKTGINNNVKVQILEGLAEGDKVVIGDATPAVAGS
ncbi:efflux transporter periplasmic adaptor subunit, partial [Corynebacterium pseudodiphtheriticum]